MVGKANLNLIHISIHQKAISWSSAGLCLEVSTEKASATTKVFLGCILSTATVEQSHPCIFYFSTYKNIYEAILLEGAALACTFTLKLCILKACVPSDAYYPLGYLRCFNPRAHHKIYSTDSPHRHREDLDLIPTSASHLVTRL